MPKILINEKDKTSPGTPASYANYSVLITGFSTNAPADLADSNGVYEFSNAQDFKDVIGLVAPKVAKQDKATVYHYGNQMAYELLNMGYSIIYKPINNVDEMTDANFWEIFKDKASYDFRFITHGLLESSSLSDEEAFITASNSLVDVEDAIKVLQKIKDDFKVAQKTDSSLEEAAFKNTAYSNLIKENPPAGLIDPKTGKAYTNFTNADTGTVTRKAELEATIANLTNGAVTDVTINKVNALIADLAKYVANDESGEIPGRGDCIALIELDENAYVSATTKPELAIINAINKMSDISSDPDKGKYCALTVPSVFYKMTIDKDKPNEFENNTKFPGAFHYLACFMNSLKLGFAEWYAAAGYTRGVSGYTIEHTSVKLGEIAINALEPRNISSENDPKFACNVIANFRGSYYLWGNRTAHNLGDKASATTGDLVASHFLNIRQLCTTIKKQLYVACRRFTFDPNSDTLWVNFCNAIRPTLDAMKADQGIRDYKILKVYTDKKATLKAKIRIIPIEAVEDFDLEVSLEDSFGETTAVVTE